MLYSYFPCSQQDYNVNAMSDSLWCFVSCYWLLFVWYTVKSELLHWGLNLKQWLYSFFSVTITKNYRLGCCLTILKDRNPTTGDGKMSCVWGLWEFIFPPLLPLGISVIHLWCPFYSAASAWCLLLVFHGIVHVFVYVCTRVHACVHPYIPFI